MAEFKSNFTIEAENSHEAAVINQMFKFMAQKMDKKTLLKAAQKINSNPDKKIKRLESGVLVL